MNTVDGDYVGVPFLLCIIEDYKKRITENTKLVQSWHTEEDAKTLSFSLVFKGDVKKA